MFNLLTIKLVCWKIKLFCFLPFLLHRRCHVRNLHPEFINQFIYFAKKFFYVKSTVCLFCRCETCDKKVDTVKRLCVKKLPPILVIQLKRFDYDYERMCLIKFNDYFEFPRELDMEPYTVGGLAKIEGEAVDCDPSDLDGRQVRKYR